MKFILETERLLLREFIESDAAAYFELDACVEVHRYLGNNPMQSIDQAHEKIAELRKQYREYGIGRWAAIEKASGNFIGWSGLKFRNEYENNHIHFHDAGYRLHPTYWGKGYATESCKAALKYGFTVMKLPEIIGTANEENKASIHALQKCGLRFVEKFMWKDIRCDWMKITNEEWAYRLTTS